MNDNFASVFVTRGTEILDHKQQEQCVRKITG